MLLKKNLCLLIPVLSLTFTAFTLTPFSTISSAEEPKMLYSLASNSTSTKKKSQTFDVYAGESFHTGGIDCKVGKQYICKNYPCHIEAGQTVSITWDSDKQCKSGKFKVGLVNEAGKKFSLKIGKNSNVTKKIKVSETGIYYFYLRPKKANCKDGTVKYDFDIKINKAKTK